MYCVTNNKKQHFYFALDKIILQFIFLDGKKNRKIIFMEVITCLEMMITEVLCVLSVLVHNKQSMTKKLLDYPVEDHVKVVQVKAYSIPQSTIYHKLRFLKSKHCTIIA